MIPPPLIPRSVNNSGNNLNALPRTKSSRLGSFIVSLLSHTAPLGGVVGTFMGLARRLNEHRIANWVSQDACRAGMPDATLNVVYQGMQNYYMDTPLKYALPLTSVVMVGVAAYNGAENQGGGWRKVAWVVSLIGLVAASPIVKPFIELTTANPSIDFMAQAVLGVAVGQVVSAASRFGMSTVACMTTLGAMGLAAANTIFFSGSAYACHSPLETFEGAKWAVVAVAGSYVIVRTLSAGVSLCSYMIKRHLPKARQPIPLPPVAAPMQNVNTNKFSPRPRSERSRLLLERTIDPADRFQNEVISAVSRYEEPSYEEPSYDGDSDDDVDWNADTSESSLVSHYDFTGQYRGISSPHINNDNNRNNNVNNIKQLIDVKEESIPKLTEKELELEKDEMNRRLVSSLAQLRDSLREGKNDSDEDDADSYWDSE